MIVLASASIIVIACGMICLNNAELAWRVYEWDCRMMGTMPPRLRDWRTRVKQIGYGLIALGIMGFMLGIGG